MSHEALLWVHWFAFVALSLLGIAFGGTRRLRLHLARWLTPLLPPRAMGRVRALLFYRLFWLVLYTLSWLVLAWQVGSAMMYAAEGGKPHFEDLRNTSLAVLGYLFSGIEDNKPETTWGWAATSLMLLTGLAITAYITGQFASEIVRHTLGGMRMQRNLAKDAMLLIGWDTHGERVVQEFFWAFDARVPERSIVVLSDERVDPALHPVLEARGVTFVAGNTTDKQVLERVGAHLAHSVIVLADHEAQEPDGGTALTVLALRSLCRAKGIPDADRPVLCAEALQHDKMELIRDAGADEVVCHEDYGLGVLAQTALSRKIADVYHHLLTCAEHTCEIFMLTGPDSEGPADIPSDVWDRCFEGKTFPEAAAVFTQRRDPANPQILIGVRQGDQVRLNPREPLRLRWGDDLIVIAWSRPRLESLRDLAVPARRA